METANNLIQKRQYPADLSKAEDTLTADSDSNK